MGVSQYNVFERCFRLIYNDKHSPFEDLLEKNNSVFINHNNLQALAIGKIKYTTHFSGLGARKL